MAQTEIITNTPTPSFARLNLRAMYYRVVTPLGALLGFYGLVADQEWAFWLALANAVVGGSGLLPIVNTPTREALPSEVRGEEAPPTLF